MDIFFAPASLAVYGISSKNHNVARIIVENCRRWGYRGQVFGVNPTTQERSVNGVRVVRSAAELPVVPELAVLLVPARYVPEAMEDCARAGIRRLAIQTGGFNESDQEGKAHARRIIQIARDNALRFVGPNSLALADTGSGLCLPFVPSYPVRQGGFSLVTQSGGLGIFLWNLLNSEQVGMAKFSSIGNKLDLDECDFLEYLGSDPATTVIGLYLESVNRGRQLLALAEQMDKPVIVYKANVTQAGGRAAMSHTASLSNDDAVLDAAFERAGIIRIRHLHDFITTAKAFNLPPMRGKRIMVMTPAGGLGVAMADLCEQHAFSFADPGPDFYAELAGISNAGVIDLNNPLDMGDLYQVDRYSSIFSHVLASDSVDGAVFASQQPHMPPGGTDVFTAMFNTDLTLGIAGAIRSSGKPLALALYGDDTRLRAIKQQTTVPVFNGPEEAVGALYRQMRFYGHKTAGVFVPDPDLRGLQPESAQMWLHEHCGVVGEEALQLLGDYGIPILPATIATTPEEAVRVAVRLGFPVVLKVVSPQVVHKTEVNGVLINVADEDGVVNGFADIREHLLLHRPEARFDGVRVTAMAPSGHDLFIGGLQDPSFGPIVMFGDGGILVELYQDVERVLCPTSLEEVRRKIDRLKVAKIFAGIRGRQPFDPAPFAQSILTLSHVLVNHPEIREIDVNPIRLTASGGVYALDARLYIADQLQSFQHEEQ